MYLIKQFLSLIIPQVIYKTSSPVSGEIEIVQHHGERSLIVGGLVQSVSVNAFGLRRRVWGRLVSAVAREMGPAGRTLESVLLLGLGGGTMVHLLRRRSPAAVIDAVEIDPVIVQIANDYFGLKRVRGLRTIIGDAREVVRHPETFKLSVPRYSLIIVDLYLGSVFPTFAGSEEFMAGLDNLLADGGLVAFNRVEEDDRFLAVVQDRFNRIEVTLVVAPGGGKNYLYCGVKK